MKELLYLILTFTDEKAKKWGFLCPNLGIEYLGNCAGIIVNYNGLILGSHYSSTFGFLTMDLLSKIKHIKDFEIINLIGKEVPAKLIKKINENKENKEDGNQINF